MKRCPYCAEAIQDDALVCPHCRTNLTANVYAVPQPAATPSQPSLPGDAYPTAPPQTSGKATASLVAGISAYVIVPFIGAIVAIVLGHLGLSEVKKSAGRLKGDGMAIAGMVLGYVQIAGLPFILIIAAIAIPNLIKAKMAANEASAAGSLRTLATGEIAYSSACPNLGFTDSLTELGPNGTACSKGESLIDGTLAQGSKSGYVFSAHESSFTGRSPETGFGWNADPVSNSTGARHFFVDETGVIHYSQTGPADADSLVLK